MTLSLNSPAFAPNGDIPKEYTCDGKDLAPPLEWSGAPAGTKSFALIIDDPDAPDPKAPKTTWVHWVLYDIPASVTALPKAATKDLPAGTREGVNDWKRTGYGGPCPPIGRHRYFHKLYALDVPLGDLGRLRRQRSSGPCKVTSWGRPSWWGRISAGSSRPNARKQSRQLIDAGPRPDSAAPVSRSRAGWHSCRETAPSVVRWRVPSAQ
jgi:Raf kinase inhibitor-like YbhB/YbcL family protein